MINLEPQDWDMIMLLIVKAEADGTISDTLRKKIETERFWEKQR